MAFFIKKLLQKTAEKGLKIHPQDIFTQQNVDDVIQILKELIS